MSCSVPEHPSHGRVIFNTVTFNSLISYECNYGYMIIGTTNVVSLTFKRNIFWKYFIN